MARGNLRAGQRNRFRSHGTCARRSRPPRDASGIRPLEALEGRRLLSFADVSPPTAEIGAAPDVTTAGGTQYVLSVNWSDNAAVLTSSLSTGDLVVTSGMFSATPVLLNVDDPENGTPRVATYRFTPPGGSWDAADNGVYTISVEPFQVSDINGNICPPGAIGTFVVNIGPRDTTPPAAVLTAPDVTAGGAAIYNFAITYTDDVAVFTGSLGGGEVIVSNTAANYVATATFLDLDSLLNGPQRLAVYRIVPPGGTWDVADNGSYTVSLLADSVRDVNGNYMPGGIIGTFNVNISPPDQTPPTRALKAALVTRAGAKTYSFAVTYRDPSLVDATTVGNRDVYVIGPRNYRAYAVLVSKKPSGNGATIIATYRITPPGRSWDRGDNGVYSIMMAARQVADVPGNFIAAGRIGTFKVAIGTAPARLAAALPAQATPVGCPAQTPCVFGVRRIVAETMVEDPALLW